MSSSGRRNFCISLFHFPEEVITSMQRRSLEIACLQLCAHTTIHTYSTTKLVIWKWLMRVCIQYQWYTAYTLSGMSEVIQAMQYFRAHNYTYQQFLFSNSTWTLFRDAARLDWVSHRRLLVMIISLWTGSYRTVANMRFRHARLSVGCLLLIGMQGIRKGRSFVKNTLKIVPCSGILQADHVLKPKTGVTIEGAILSRLFCTKNCDRYPQFF